MLFLHTFKLNSSVHSFIYFYFWSLSFSFTFTSPLSLVSSPLSSATVHHHLRFSERSLASVKKESVSARGDSNFILQSYCAFLFHFSLSFCWVFLAYSNLHHPALKKLPKLPKKRKKKRKEKKAFRVSARYPFIGRNSRILPVQSVFFLVWNKRVINTGLLASMVYTDHTGQYGTKLTSLN